MKFRKESKPAPTGRVARRIVIRGKVQGVGFRYFARTQAEALGVGGWVRNLADGRTLEAHLEGSPEGVREAAEWIGRGPIGARVESVEVLEHEVCGVTSFEIRV